MDEAGSYFIQRDGSVKKPFQRGGFAVGDATGNDKVEIAEVCSDVVGESMRADPAAQVHAERRDGGPRRAPRAEDERAPGVGP